MPGLDWLIERPIAHRGLHGDGCLENTLAAAAAAAAAGYGVEVDLQLTADGEAVIFHDTDLGRLTTGKGPVAARSVAELKELSFRGGGGKIPTLQELLDTVAGSTPLLLELKSGWNGDARIAVRTAELLTNYVGPVAAMSFDPELVLTLQTRAPGLPRGIVAERYYDDQEWRRLPRGRKFTFGNLLHVGHTKPHFVAYYVRDLPALAPLLLRYALGVKLLTWTVRTEDERSRAHRWADQMIFEGFRP